MSSGVFSEMQDSSGSLVEPRPLDATGLPESVSASVPVPVPVPATVSVPVSVPRLPAGAGRGVLAGAFELLNVLARSEAAGLSELARATDLPKTTVYRLLTQMTDIGMVERDELSCYRVGAGLRRMVGPERPYRWLDRPARGPSAALARVAGASVGLTVLHEARLVAVSTVVPPRGLAFEAGTSVPLSTASGQVLLADRAELGPPPIFSEYEWRRVRSAIRQQGTAFDRQDLVDGICCVAAPVRGSDGRVVAALSAILVADRVRPSLVDSVTRAAREISRRLAGPQSASASASASATASAPAGSGRSVEG